MKAFRRFSFWAVAPFAVCCCLGQGDYDAQVVEARDAIRTGNAAAALTAASNAISKNPDRWEAYVVAGTALSLQGDPDQAVLMLSKGLGRAPQEKHAGIEAMIGDVTAKKASSASRPPALMNAPATPATGFAGMPIQPENVPRPVPSISKAFNMSHSHVGFPGKLADGQIIVSAAGISWTETDNIGHNFMNVPCTEFGPIKQSLYDKSSGFLAISLTLRGKSYKFLGSQDIYDALKAVCRNN
jgi:hypothetical protein